jgi:hypothetical protein
MYEGDMNIADVRAFLKKWNTPLVYDIHHFTLADAQKKARARPPLLTLCSGPVRVWVIDEGVCC